MSHGTAKPESSRYPLHSECFRAEYRKLLGFTMQKFRLPQPDAEDIVMKLAAESCKHEFADVEEVRKFFWGRIISRGIDFLRAQGRMADLVKAAGAAAACAPDERGGDPAASVPDRLYALEVLAQLPEREREYAAMILSGLTPEELAKQLGIKPGAERVRRHRLTDKIKTLATESREAQR
ncbi:sigma-70 family RNA polymerase sigma factor [Streptomyces sp. NPDC056468]|uniref:sigma-70 family RNA polymerase sigma factor n=1 Tax=Streptomyces sp. NPDC056468 TaxID=3345830 RepID=UPI0036783988